MRSHSIKLNMVLAAGFVAILFSAAPCAGATTNTWIAPTIDNWSHGTAWSQGTVPAAGDNVIFDGSVSNATCTVDQNTNTVGSLTMQNGYTGTLTFSSLSVYTLSVGGNVALISGATLQGTAAGYGTLSFTGNLTNSGITVSTTPNLTANGTAAQALDGIVGLGTFTVNSTSTVTLNGPIGCSIFGMVNGTLSGSSVTASSSFDLMSGTVASVLAGTGAATTSGYGTVTLTAANTYSGGTQVYAMNPGTLQLGNASALGSGPLMVQSGTLDLNSYGVTVSGLQGTGGIITDNSAGAGNTTLTVNQINNTACGAVIQNGTSKSLSLALSGTGMLVLTGASTYTGSTTISAGTLQLGVNNALPTGTALSVSGTLDLAGASQTLGALLSNGTVTNTSNDIDSTLTVAFGGTDTFSGTITDSFPSTNRVLNLTLSGPGTLTLSGINTYFGSTVVNGGTLQLGVGNALPAGTALTVAGGATVDCNGFNQSVAVLEGGASTAGTVANSGGPATFSVANSIAETFAGTLTGANLSLAMNGTGQLTLSGANTYGGGTTINAGTLQIGNTSALGSGGLTINGSTLDLDGNSITVASLAGTGGAIVALVSMGADPPVVLTVNQGINTTYDGVIQDGLATLSLTKSGSGTLSLTGTNNFTGATTINGGTLEVNGSDSNSAVTINSGGTLAGMGTVADVTVPSGQTGTLSPGSAATPVATLATGNVTLASSATYKVALDSVAPAADEINAGTQAVDLGGSTLSVTSNGNPALGKTYTIVNAGTVSGTFNGLPNGSFFAAPAVSRWFQISYSATAVTLTDVIPPPIITSPTTAAVTINQAFSYQITANNNPASYNATGLPSWAAVNTSTGAITGTPDATGSTNVTLSATNATGTGIATLTITVNPPLPVISSPLTATGGVGQAFSYQIAATNSPASFNATSLPAWASVNTGTGAITGTPNAASSTNVTISATNAGGTGSATLAININPLPPAITSAATATGTTGVAF
ncbi:MAG: autotransporter-associated beta strand repeat-containing protein, partial [Planctomycetota bacterium]